MRSSNRIALPLAIGLHLLLLIAVSRQSAFVQPLQTLSKSLTIRLIPPDLPKPLAPIPLLPSAPHKEPALSGTPKRHAEPIENPVPHDNPVTAPTEVPTTASQPESKGDSRPALNDPAALVKSYSYEDSKSDLQKAIESHGGTVAITKGQYDEFHQQMDFASIPDCLRPDALKHDPPKIGPVVIGGYLPLLFLAHAALTGKCK